MRSVTRRQQQAAAMCVCTEDRCEWTRFDSLHKAITRKRLQRKLLFIVAIFNQSKLYIAVKSDQLRYLLCVIIKNNSLRYWDLFKGWLLSIYVLSYTWPWIKHQLSYLKDPSIYHSCHGMMFYEINLVVHMLINIY